MPGYINAKNPSATLTLTASASGRVALPVSCSAVRVFWDGATPVYFQDGNSTVASSLSAGSLTSFLPSPGVEMFQIDPNSTHISGISASAGTLYIQCISAGQE